MWSREIIGVKPVGWDQCTMITSHTIDSRKKYTSLKFQSYMNFGIYPHDQHVAPFLKGHPFNKIDECGLEDLLFYGGEDALYEAMLLQKQHEELSFNSTLLSANDFMLDGAKALCNTHSNGIPVNEEYYKEDYTIRDFIEQRFPVEFFIQIEVKQDEQERDIGNRQL